jgi:hypothetical protein
VIETLKVFFGIRTLLWAILLGVHDDVMMGLWRYGFYSMKENGYRHLGGGAGWRSDERVSPA